MWRHLFTWKLIDRSTHSISYYFYATKSQALLTITPKQNGLKTQIADLQSIVNGLYKQRNLGLLGKNDKMSLEKYEKNRGA